MPRIPTILAMVALMAVAMPLAAQVYRWVDANGNVHYSDRPPPEAEVERMPIQVQPTDLEEMVRQERDREERLSLRDQDRADDAHDAEAERRDRENLARSCQQARERVSRIESARRLSRVDEQGNRHTYDEAERAAALAEARAQAAEWCR